MQGSSFRNYGVIFTIFNKHCQALSPSHTRELLEAKGKLLPDIVSFVTRDSSIPSGEFISAFGTKLF